jgi:tripeptide aminopeptidase
VTFTSTLAETLAPDVLDRFLRYVRIDTQSERERKQSPSTSGQLDLGRLLVEELLAIGLGDAALDDNGYVTATLPGTGPAVGLIAHVDTSPDAPGAGVEPIVHRAYAGARIELPRGGTVLDPGEMPTLAKAVGHDIVTSSGDTLLGADDKAGVAEIMAAVTHLAANPDLPRPTLRICFTPDEEIGEGATLFDVEAFGAVCAYTLDGSDLGELQDETFAAEEVMLAITGVDAHPGWAKDTLVNATRLAAEIVAALPRELHPRLRDRRDRRQGVRARDRARLRRRQARRPHRAARPHCPGGRGPRAGREARGRRHAAVPEHAPLHRAFPAGHGQRREGAP